MDESFLSRPEVIEASRQFVCIRVATYENEEEAKVLKRIFIGRSGQLENTTFALLSPDGQRLLARPGRGPNFAFGHSSDAKKRMAQSMNQIAQRYRGGELASTPPLPTSPDVRLAINVASCDNQPLVIVVGRDADEMAALEQRLAPVAWSDQHIGAFQYVSTHHREDVAYVDGVKVKSGVIVIQPGQFGLGGEVLEQVDASAEAAAMGELLARSAKLYKPWAKTSREHISAGVRQGIEWETLMPITDPGGPRR